MENQPQEAWNLAEFEALAKKVLSKDLFDHVAAGADDELAAQENLLAFRRIKLLTRVLRDVTSRSMTVTVIGEPISFPVILGPVACLRRFHPDGELAVVRAAARMQTICVLSTGTCYSLEEVALSTKGPLWFQLYSYRDRGITQALVQRAQASGYKAVCLTVDVPISGRRERDFRNRYTYPCHLLHSNLMAVGFKDLSPELTSQELHAFAARELCVPLTWDYLDWLKSNTRLPLLLKGILSVEDARRAVSYGMKGIIVSNHGGRQLDASPASIDVLPQIVEAVDGKAEVLFDSGIRRGTDVLKALALGAKAVLVGRPYVWALAVEGGNGVERVLDLLRQEFDTAMALTGCSRIADISRELIWKN